MSRPIVKTHNTQTNEIVEREMNDAEFAQYEIDQAKIAADKVKAETEAQAKVALLEKLGISEDEARLLLA